LKLKHDKPLSNFAFNCKLRHYIKELSNKLSNKGKSLQTPMTMVSELLSDILNGRHVSATSAAECLEMLKYSDHIYIPETPEISDMLGAFAPMGAGDSHDEDEQAVNYLMQSIYLVGRCRFNYLG